MDFHSLEKLASKRKATLVFNERALNEDEVSNYSKKMNSSQASFYQKIKPNQVDPFTIYGAGGKNHNIREMCHGKSWLRNSNMTEVIEGKFLRNSIEERILRKEDSIQRASSNFIKGNMESLKMKKALRDI